ncbi:MAG TPA: mechanosensitive ion channel domain-containing protein [Geminicoccaceae bacterium]|nr:mechanosensitive ion channel domain-containing protein [Geminicoccaceae bacterium]
MARALRCCVLLVLLLGPVPSSAQNELSEAQFERLTQRWHRTLDDVRDDLRDLTITGDLLAALRENIGIVEESATEARDRAASQAAERQALLDAMGPAPAEGEPPEDPVVATQRSVIIDRLSHELGRVARSSVVLARVRDLYERTVEEETFALFDSVRERTVSPLVPSVALKGARDLGSRLGELRHSASRSWRVNGLLPLWSQAGAAVAVIVAVTVLIGLPFRHWLLASFGPEPEIDNPSATRRFGAAMALILGNAVLPGLVFLGLQAAMSLSPNVASDLRLSIEVLLRVARDVVPLVGLAHAILTPRLPQWRISYLTDEAAKHVFRTICTYAVALLLIAPFLVAISPKYAQGHFFELSGFRTELSALGGSVAVVLFGLAMLNLVRPRNWKYRPDSSGDESEQEHGGTLARTATALIASGVIAAMVLCVIGYVNLGVFVVSSMTRTLILLGYAFALRTVLYRGLQVATSANNQLGAWVRHRLVIDDSGASRFMFWVMLTVDVLGATVVIVTILVMWGLPSAVLDQGTDLAVTGIDLGGFNLSLLSIGMAVGIFAVLLTIVRVFRRFLADRVLVQTRLDLGVRDALVTGVSYVGYILAALITFAVLGLNLGNIALIFGALSVGIGFGLQHVVSNFISGLILLVQRPIKTGDWIVVGDQQGYVRRISVISTEIQTFDAAAVIVPNSTMLSNQVINWHLHNKLGRVIINVGVSYDSDPEQVRNVLLACAAQNPDLLRRPAPQVLFRNFGDSSLDFELRFFLREIDELLRVGSDLRFAIKKAFAEAGIEIPYPQRDVHIRGGPPGKLVPIEETRISTPKSEAAR